LKSKSGWKEKIAGTFVGLHRESVLKGVLLLVVVLSLAIVPAVPAFAQTVTPTVVSSRGYYLDSGRPDEPDQRQLQFWRH
jgi:hypothetical protein